MDDGSIVVMKPEFAHSGIFSEFLFDSLADVRAILLFHLKHQHQVLIFTVTGIDVGSAQGNRDGFPQVVHGGI